MPIEEDKPSELLRNLWDDFDFKPNLNQMKAILHVNGPLFLPAGPGSGKTRVLLWRTVNLIVTHEVAPEDIFLSTFTEKAAKQLKDGLRTLLTAAGQMNGNSYDLSRMYVGTVHSLCRRILTERRFSQGRHRNPQPILLDELSQYLFIRKKSNWEKLTNSPKEGHITNTRINQIFRETGKSRHKAITSLISFFNRLSEEMIDTDSARRRTKDKILLTLLDLYDDYLNLLAGPAGPRRTDLSLIQKIAVEYLQHNPKAGDVFKHVIIDEYQDTNTVQEKLFFTLSSGSKNLCVVGDDDQALYRFRGATVENFVNFSERCKSIMNVEPRKLILSVNYRSCEGIVSYSNDFMKDDSCDWKRVDSSGYYRVMDKEIKHEREGNGAEVVYSNPGRPEDVAEEIANLIKELLNKKKVSDPNQIAFLFPSLRSNKVEKMKEALEDLGLQVYAPRAGIFLEVQESLEIFGLILQLFYENNHEHPEFSKWLDSAIKIGKELCYNDPYLQKFIESKRTEMSEASEDYSTLTSGIAKEGWTETDPYDPDKMRTKLLNMAGLSSRARKALGNGLFYRSSKNRFENNRPFNLRYVVTRASSVDWNFLDLFYQICGFKHFRNYFDLAEENKDEGPICNLSLISQYISRYVDEYSGLISGNSIQKGFTEVSFKGFLYVLFRREESEYEDANDPFPKGRIPFLTIHQAKGLEFPVVVLANPRKDPKIQTIERIVSPLLTREGEPIEKIPLYDAMRMFYVGISRAKNLLVIPYYRSQGQRLNPPFLKLEKQRPKINELDMDSVEVSIADDEELPLSYSYTGDYLLYLKCPRQYMIFRKYGFVPSRSQTMFFGSLVHQTLEDLHQTIINWRNQK